MTIAQLDALYSAAAAAMADADWSTAITNLMAISARLATTPNLTRNLGPAGSQAITWNAAEIQALIGQCRKQQAAAQASSSGLFGQTPITYARATT